MLEALLAASLLIIPVKAKPIVPHEPDGPQCVQADQALAAIKLASPDALAVRLDGDAAQHLLDAINHTGEPTDLHAKTLVIRASPDVVMIGLFNACMVGRLSMTATGFREALTTMQRARV